MKGRPVLFANKLLLKPYQSVASYELSAELVARNRYSMRLMLLMLLTIGGSLQADTRLIAYLTHAPAEIIHEVEENAHKERLLEKMNSFDQKNPGYFSKQQLKAALQQSLRPALGGILALYGGYSDYSNADGLIGFPLRHESNKLYIAITESILPVKAVGETISHIECYDPVTMPIDFFILERKEDAAKQSYWNVKKQTVPADRKLPLATLIILTKPSNIMIMTGDSFAQKSNHLITPPLYLVGNSNQVETITKLLDIQPYFEPIDCAAQPSGDFIIQTRIVNL